MLMFALLPALAVAAFGWLAGWPRRTVALAALGTFAVVLAVLLIMAYAVVLAALSIVSGRLT
jgi:hypothetical protein